MIYNGGLSEVNIWLGVHAMGENTAGHFENKNNKSVFVYGMWNPLWEWAM